MPDNVILYSVLFLGGGSLGFLICFAKSVRQAGILREKLAAANSRLDAERRAGEEKLVLLNEAKERLSEQFRLLAQEVLEQKGSVLAEGHEKRLSGLLNPLKEELKDFRKKVDEVHVEESKQRASLKNELEHLSRLNQQLNQEAINLTRALKGDSKTQGTWGELVLERVLEESGLRKGEEYETQKAKRNADDKLYKPDVIVHLPEGKDIVVDSKVSLKAYEEMLAAENDDLREKALQRHTVSVKQHIQELSEKDYTSLKEVDSLDFVLMFMPVEAAFIAAFHYDSSLFTYAFERRVIVVTPTTLLACLRTIETIWRYERRNRNSVELADRAAAVYDKLRGFVEDMEKLGRQINTVQATYEASMNKLCRGRGNLIRQASQFSEYGVKITKPLPSSVVERSELG